MAKRGKAPSLIGGGAGRCKLATALRKRTCKRCGDPIPGGTDCVEVNVPSTMGHKCYCVDCFREVLDKTRAELNDLVTQVKAL